jgi:hypothetical protein
MKFIFTIALTMSGQIIYAQGISDELQHIYRIDDLPLYSPDTRAGQFSSYDRTGGNDDGFNGTYSYLRKEGDDLVIAEMKGPGVITRIWTPTPSEDTIEFYFDGESHPRISIPFIDLFSGEHYPFTDPLCGHEVGGYYCYLPMPYKRSCKVILKGGMLFYQLQYSSYDGKNQVKSFPEDWSEPEVQALNKAIESWCRDGPHFPDGLYEGIHIHDTILSILPGQTQRVFDMAGGGRIVGLEMTGISSLGANDNALLLKAKWDGEDEWAINAPIKDFFGFHFGEKSMRSLLMGTSGNTSYSWYPMPFSHEALLDLEYLSGSEKSTGELELGIRIYYSKKGKGRDEGKFYAYWKRERNPMEGEPYEILPRKKGKGHYVGTILNCQGLIPGRTGYFEGDDQATIDGRLSIHGTGSEDYFNGGWYAIPDRWDMAHSLPVHGCLGYSIPLSRTGGYRHYFADKLSFQENFKLTIEHGPSGNSYPVDYSSLALYYSEEALPQEHPTLADCSYPQPEVLKFPAGNLPVVAFTNGRITNGKRIDNQRVLVLEPMENRQMLAVFNLQAPVDGTYKLYCSYYTTPSSGEIRIMQRQNELSAWKDVSSPQEVYVENEYIGALELVDGSCTVTIHARGTDMARFFLHHFILERDNKEQ